MEKEDNENLGYTEDELEELLSPGIPSKITDLVGKIIILAAIIGLTILACWSILTLVNKKIFAMSYCLLLICGVVQIICVFLINKDATNQVMSYCKTSICRSWGFFILFFLWGECVLGDYVELEIALPEDEAYHNANYYIIGPYFVGLFFAIFPYVIINTFTQLYYATVKPIVVRRLLKRYNKLPFLYYNELKLIYNKPFFLDKLETRIFYVMIPLALIYLIMVYIYRAEFIDFTPMILNVSCGLALVICLVALFLKQWNSAKVSGFLKSRKQEISTFTLYEVGLLEVLLLKNPKEIKKLRIRGVGYMKNWIKQNRDSYKEYIEENS